MNELRWDREKAVSEWIDRELKADCLQLQEAAKKRFDNDPHPPLSALELIAINALVEAEMGNMRLLVEALDPNQPLNRPEPGERTLRSYLPPLRGRSSLMCLPAYATRSRAGARNTATARWSASAAHPRGGADADT